MTKLRSENWSVARIPEHRDGIAFLERIHYAKGGANTSVYRHGLHHEDSALTLHGVAMWMPPTKNAAASVAKENWRGVLCLSRLAVAPHVPTNGASFLLGRSMKDIDRCRWPVLLTYADTGKGHTGAIYRATNWTCLGSVPAGDTWIAPDGSQRGRKRGGRNLKVADMLAAGYVRRPACPKIKFVHTV